MLLVIDVGNTNIVFGLFANKELLCDFRIKTDTALSASDYELELRSQLSARSLDIEGVDGIAMASVVPRLDPVLTGTCTAIFGNAPFCIDPRLQKCMVIRYETPETLGADRIVNAVAAYDRYKSAAIAIDMGTATTIDFVDASGAYIGGAIVPGIATAAHALFSRAAKLPEIELEYPDRVIGRTTVESMQSGIVAGYACLLSGMIGRMKSESGTGARVIATGGLTRLVAGHVPEIDDVDEHLLLRGLKILYERRTPSRE